MVVNTRIIEIVSKYVDGVTKPIEKTSRSVRRLQGNMEEVTSITKKLDQETGQYGNAITRVSQKQRGFQAQWLSLLFFGFALQRMFSGLIKTSLEWVGINELMTTTLGILFLPVAEQLLEILLPIMTWFIELPDPIKKVIGWFVVFGAIIGSVLFSVGQIALGLAGIQWLTAANGLSGIGTAAGVATGKVGRLWTAFGILVGVVAAGLTIAFIVKELQQGKVIAAIGAATAGIGFLTGNPLLIGIGIAMVIVGDKDLQIGLAKVAIKVIDFALTLGEKIGEIISAAFTLNPVRRSEKVGGALSGLNVLESFDVAAAELQRSGKIQSDILKSLPSFNVIDQETFNRVHNISPNSFGSGEINISPTYNVTVSDKREFEDMLERNNKELSEEIRRYSKV